jgi:hypothetical protein
MLSGLKEPNLNGLDLSLNLFVRLHNRHSLDLDIWYQLDYVVIDVYLTQHEGSYHVAKFEPSLGWVEPTMSIVSYEILGLNPLMTLAILEVLLHIPCY